ncbi:hypothetical protein AB0P12_27875 [Streptomyces subrutilus]
MLRMVNLLFKEVPVRRAAPHPERRRTCQPGGPAVGPARTP